MRSKTRYLAWAGWAAGVFLMLVLAWTPGISFTEDLGRHLLLGRIILDQRAVPDTNLLTYTHPGFPFVNHHWLSEVILYLLHRAVGLNGLIVWKMLMLGAALGLALAVVRPRGAAGWWAAAGVLAAVVMGFRAHIRPELFTYLLVAVYLRLFEEIRRGRTWPRWALVAAACFWANAHIYFIFGLFMAAAFALERGWRASRQMRLREAAWVGAMVLASCVNPNGAAGLLYPLRIFENYGIGITENASPLEYWRTVLNPMLLALPLLSALVLAAIAATWRDERPANRLIAAGALAAAWLMARSAPLLALAALPVVAAASRREPGGWWRWVDGVGTVAAAAAGFWIAANVIGGSYARVFPSPIGPTPFGFDDEARYGRLRELAERQGLKGPVFTDYNLGSLVEYELYPEPGYVDNRPEAFPASFWRTEYLPALALAGRWEEVSAARGFNAIIVSLAGVKEAFTQELMRRPEWVLVHVDGICGAWVRNEPANEPLISALAFGPARAAAFDVELARRLDGLPSVPWWRRAAEADELVYRMYALICIGEGQRAWPHILRMHRMYPDYQIVHELMRVTAPPEGVAGVEAVMSARARWPLAAKQVLDWGRHLVALGRMEEARDVFRRGRRFFPFSGALREELQAVDDRLFLRGRSG